MVSKDPKCLQADSKNSDQTTDVQADLNLRWKHVQSCRKWCALAHIFSHCMMDNQFIYLLIYLLIVLGDSRRITTQLRQKNLGNPLCVRSTWSQEAL